MTFKVGHFSLFFLGALSRNVNEFPPSRLRENAKITVVKVYCQFFADPFKFLVSSYFLF